MRSGTNKMIKLSNDALSILSRAYIFISYIYYCHNFLFHIGFYMYRCPSMFLLLCKHKFAIIIRIYHQRRGYEEHKNVTKLILFSLMINK